MKRLLASVFLGVCGVLACALDTTDFTGKACEEARDCPPPYVCVAARGDAGRTCEVLGLPGTPDGGDAGPTPTWCADIQPILAANCVSSCHGADTSGSDGAPFRLDYYAPEPGGVPGAQAMAARILARVYVFQDMPPPWLSVPMPSAQERVLIARWANEGTPLCDDAGTGDVERDAAVDGRP
ncbi:hypothetical protein [Myxococcus hansupus]|uniref:hypothetical protein n=1 Tax=Pseudomyxococcus hansupus TaxID=1297742 RepID=UPI0005D112AE|nr:hypothetical protein [Myxococcus hansupus]